jgi:site-specific recombinase XerD
MTDASNRIESENGEHRPITIITNATCNRLNERQQVDYREHRKSLIDWMLHLGKNPKKAEGYSFPTVRRRAYGLDRFYRWVWEENEGYTTQLTHDDADAYCRHLVYEDSSDSHKHNAQKELKMLFRWRDDCEKWTPEVSLVASNSTRTKPRDYLTQEERRKIREATLEHGTVPNPRAIHGDEYQEWKIHLAQRFRKPTSEITSEDFDRANGFKIPSIVWTSLDAGLRPVEVGRAKTYWVDTDNAVLRIPRDEASKGDDNWIISLQERTATMLSRWLDERTLYDKYDDSDHLWLTREGNPYSSRPLKYLLNKLCETAGIKTEDRQMSWYAIRHSVGTYMAREEGLEAAASQLRHQSVQTTRKYDAAPVEERRDALDRMG